MDSDQNKKITYHFHRIKDNKYHIIESILVTYGFPQKRIEDLISGESIYQFILAQNNAPRIIVERLGNIFSVLFLDVNHHIYMEKSLTDNSGSLFFDVCPIYENNNCDYMSSFCMAFDYLDKEKLKESFGYSYA